MRGPKARRKNRNIRGPSIRLPSGRVSVNSTRATEQAKYGNNHSIWIPGSRAGRFASSQSSNKNDRHSRQRKRRSKVASTQTAPRARPAKNQKQTAREASERI